MDADVRCDPNMIQNLHTELEDSPNAAGIMARYSFEFAENKKYTASERSFLYGQRAEFAMKTTIQQVRRQTEILGAKELCLGLAPWLTRPNRVLDVCRGILIRR